MIDPRVIARRSGIWWIGLGTHPELKRRREGRGKDPTSHEPRWSIEEGIETTEDYEDCGPNW
jgi:hypothetical protein